MWDFAAGKGAKRRRFSHVSLAQHCIAVTNLGFGGSGGHGGGVLFRSFAMTTTSPLFQPLDAGPLSLRNRIAMAPMTRSRAPGAVPNALMREYYRQRADAGVQITEGVAPSPEALGYARIPGIYNVAQARAWGDIAQAVHERGGKLVVQLMHTGRIAHALNLPEGAIPVGPSAVAAEGQMWTDDEGMQPMPVPKAMDEADIARVKAAFVRASEFAIAAGADGVELHAANGYLLAQFLNPKSNLRTDAYGGSGENRARFLLEVVDAVAAAIGRERLGVRLSPFNTFNDLAANYEGEEAELLALVRELSARKTGYLHLIATPGAVPPTTVDAVRAAFDGVLMLAGDFNRERAEAALAAGRADLIAFARPFIANPDLPRRLREQLPLAEFDPGTLYAGGPKGYADYPAYDALAAEAA
jgi:N-ethylmaleimide reductase